jgi:imidazolonepropionase-like amidohydrolase
LHASYRALPERYILRQANVLQTDGTFEGPCDVSIEDGRIHQVGTDVPADGRESIDLRDTWLMPGLVDCHVHLTMSTVDTAELLKRPLSRWALESAAMAEKTLRSGVTMARDAGGADAGLRDAITAGLVRGPRMSILMLSHTGGHADGFLQGMGSEASSGLLIPERSGFPSALVDSAEGVRLTVRRLKRLGADWIKLCATGGIFSDHDHPLEQDLLQEEIGVAVREAPPGRVMAHAYGGAGLDAAIEAGVRSIEHGTFLSEEQAQRMVVSDVSLVPTLDVLFDDIANARAGSTPPHVAAKAALVQDALGEVVPIARAAGVKLAVGTDALEARRHGSVGRELLALHEAGLSAEETLLAGTINGAELCGLGDQLGRVAPGYVCDLLIWDDDPSAIAEIADPVSPPGVLIGGRIAVGHPRLGQAGSRPASSRVVYERTNQPEQSAAAGTAGVLDRGSESD